MHIFDFLIHSKSPNHNQLLILGSICNKISKQETIRNHFEEYWKLLLLNFISSERDKQEFNTLQDLLKKKTFRRVYCILSEIRKEKIQRVFSKYVDCVEYRVGLFGSDGVGKSSIVYQYFPELHVADPTIEDRHQQIVKRDGRKVMLNVLDTTEEYGMCFRDRNIRESQVIVYVMSKDVTTEQHLIGFVKVVLNVKDDDVNVPIVFVVNKTDLGDDFPMEWIDNAIEKGGFTNYSIMKTSAKTREGVHELFEEVMRRARIGNINTMDCIKSILNMDQLECIKHTKDKKTCLIA